MYYSPQCQACHNLIGQLRQSSIRDHVRLVDATRLPPDQMRRVQSVPTVVLPDGSAHVGARAFQWVAQHAPTTFQYAIGQPRNAAQTSGGGGGGEGTSSRQPCKVGDPECHEFGGGGRRLAYSYLDSQEQPADDHARGWQNLNGM